MVFPVVGEHLSLAQASVVQGLVADVLEGEGHAVQVIQRLVQAGDCEGYRCERERLKRYGGVFAIVPSVWPAGAREDAALTYEVAFALVTDDAVYEGMTRFDGRALTDTRMPVGSDVVEAQSAAYDAFRDSVVELLDRRALGPGPWLTVNSDVPGALVAVDGVPRGRAPALIHVEEGDRRVVVRNGERELAMTVRVGPKGSMVEVEARFDEVDASPREGREGPMTAVAGPGRDAAVDGDAASVALTHAPMEPDAVARSMATSNGMLERSARPDAGHIAWRRWGVFLGALTVGAVLLAPPVMTMLGDSCDSPEVGQGCRAATFGPVSALQATAGVLAVSGGVLFALHYSVPID